MFEFVAETVPLVDHLDHDDGVRNEELLDEAGSLDLRMSHQEHDHDLYLIDEREKVEELGDVVQHRIEDPVSSPVSKLGVVGLLAAELSQKKQCFVGRVQEVAEDVHSDEE